MKECEFTSQTTSLSLFITDEITKSQVQLNTLNATNTSSQLTAYLRAKLLLKIFHGKGETTRRYSKAVECKQIRCFVFVSIWKFCGICGTEIRIRSCSDTAN
uniref:Uncharacterized protein n=1 Tax=Cacopsylla melanoneura TaxID=428564 RepID=A0A8D8XS35_9HEMI